MGKKARNFRIVYALAGTAWPCYSNKSKGSYLVMPSGGTKTNRGYGYAYFFTDLYKENARLKFPQGSWGPVGFEGENQYNREAGRSGMAAQLPIEIRTSASITSSSDFWADNTAHMKDDNKYYFEKTLAVISYAYLSDIFQTIINCDRPEFPIYEFLDAGDITLDIGYIDNGYEYEGGTYGGYNENFAPTSFKIVHKKSTGDTVLATDYISATTTSYKQYNVSVKPGDRIVITCGGGGTGNNGKYCLIHYGAQIAGWKEATI